LRLLDQHLNHDASRATDAACVSLCQNWRCLRPGWRPAKGKGQDRAHVPADERSRRLPAAARTFSRGRRRGVTPRGPWRYSYDAMKWTRRCSARSRVAA